MPGYHWTNEEIKILLDLKKSLKGKEISVERLKKIFPHRSNHAIYNKARNLGLKVKYYDVKIDINKDAYKELLNELKIKKIR